MPAELLEDPALPLTDVQLMLGHAQLTTTQIYLTQLSGIASAGRETAGHQVAAVPECSSGPSGDDRLTRHVSRAIPLDA